MSLTKLFTNYVNSSRVYHPMIVNISKIGMILHFPQRSACLGSQTECHPPKSWQQLSSFLPGYAAFHDPLQGQIFFSS